MIRAEEFSFTYPVPGGLRKEIGETDFFRKRALDRISLTVSRGDFVLITGDSGSGKSSLLLAMSGMIPHVTGGKIGGSLRIAGKDIRELNPSLLSETTGAAFQNPHTQLFTPTVREEIAFPLQNRGCSRSDMRDKIRQSLEFTGLAGLEDRTPRELSGGEKQRLLLAVLLAWDPPLYLLDEPLSALDPRGAGEIMDLLTRLNREKGKTIVLAEKEREETCRGISRVFHMQEGRLTDRTGRERSLFKGSGNETRPRGSKGDGHSLVLSGIHFSYPRSSSLFHDYSLVINPGETVGLTGVNGSGKTTLASLIMGVLKPRRGSVLLGGKDLTGLTVAERSAWLGYLFQNPDHQLFCPTVTEEVGFGLDREDRGSYVKDVLEYFALDRYARIPPALLSFALRKRVALATVYARDTPFVILDEPDWGQDRAGLERIVRYVREGTARGKGFLLISHNRSLVQSLADREIVLAGEGAP